MSGLDIRIVVFPTDFSDCSRHAGARAAEVARHFGARLHVLHVDDPVAAPTPPSRLTRATADLGADGDVTMAITLGVPSHAICSYAEHMRADLIVMGTHGRTGVSRAVLGSVAEAVVRHARCPVMTIRALESVPVKTEPLPAASRQCVACAKTSSDLICEACRARIRDEALEAKRAAERPAPVAPLR